jgi:hypothetical protein
MLSQSPFKGSGVRVQGFGFGGSEVPLTPF